jgi:hypothetical protein
MGQMQFEHFDFAGLASNLILLVVFFMRASQSGPGLSLHIHMHLNLSESINVYPSLHPPFVQHEQRCMSRSYEDA